MIFLSSSSSSSSCGELWKREPRPPPVHALSRAFLLRIRPRVCPFVLGGPYSSPLREERWQISSSEPARGGAKRREPNQNFGSWFAFFFFLCLDMRRKTSLPRAPHAELFAVEFVSSLASELQEMIDASRRACTGARGSSEECGDWTADRSWPGRRLLLVVGGRRRRFPLGPRRFSFLPRRLSLSLPLSLSPSLPLSLSLSLFPPSSSPRTAISSHLISPSPSHLKKTTTTTKKQLRQGRRRRRRRPRAHPRRPRRHHRQARRRLWRARLRPGLGHHQGRRLGHLPQQRRLPAQHRLRRGRRPLGRQRRGALARGLPQRARGDLLGQADGAGRVRLLLRAAPGRRHAGQDHRPVNFGKSEKASLLGAGGGEEEKERVFPRRCGCVDALLSGGG